MILGEKIPEVVFLMLAGRYAETLNYDYDAAMTFCDYDGRKLFDHAGSEREIGCRIVEQCHGRIKSSEHLILC